ncbi:MAG: hypothetical protein ACKVZJ_13905 [Phycisphaerales bacterium]
MFGEISWVHIDRLVRHYAAASAHVPNLHDLGRQIMEICALLNHRSPSFADLSAFLSPSPSEEDETERASAWLSQNVFDARAWCVGQKVLHERGKGSATRLASPILQQVARLGIAVDESVDLANVRDWWPEEIIRQDAVNAVLFNLAKSEILIVDGQSSSTARRLSNSFGPLKRADRNTLFGRAETVFGSTYAKSDAVAAVLFASELIRRTVPGFSVRSVFITFEDHGGSGRFQANEVGSLDPLRLGHQRVCLDELPVIATHEQFADRLDDNPESMLGVPSWAEIDYLKKVPVDIPVRSVMLLKTLGDRQRLVENRLFQCSPSELAKWVSDAYGFEFPRDMWRHDVLRLQRSGLMADAPNGSKTVAITPAGLARLLILEHRFNHMLPRPVGQILEVLTEHEMRWYEAQRV